MPLKIVYKIKQARERVGLTQSQLANKLSISPSAIGMYEQSRREPDYLTLIKMSYILKFFINEILEVNDCVDLEIILKNLISKIKNHGIKFKGRALAGNKLKYTLYVLKMLLLQ